MMRMKLNGMTVSRMFPALLAGVIIAFKNMITPFGIFRFSPGNIVLMAFINVVFPLCDLRPLQLFVGRWVRNLAATERAHFPEQSALFESGHWLSANRARNFYRQTIGANLILLVNVMAALFADFTAFTHAASISFQMRCAGGAGWIYSRLTHYCYLRCGFSALRARLARCHSAGFANSILSTILAANHAQVFRHTAIIPQLPNLQVNYEV